MEHSRIGAIEFDAPAAPFHHLALPLESVPLRFGLRVDGRRFYGRNAPDTLTMIEAGASGTTSWDGTFEAACFYFTTGSLAAALGHYVGPNAHGVRTQLALQAPALTRLLLALNADAASGQPHGGLVGDALFLALAAELVPDGEHHRRPVRSAGEPWRVRRALAYIHAHLAEPLSISAIADAAATSPYFLNHSFSKALGCSIWRYVLRQRARYAGSLIRDLRLTLTDVSHAAGFATYASFIAAARREYGATPSQMRRELARG